MNLYLAEFESSNFVFEGCGSTEAEACAVLDLVLHRHCINTGARLADFFVAGEVQIRKLRPGDGFVDGDKVP
jgi:hypothetical protein